MCSTEIYRKMQTKRIYSEVVVLLRTSGIPADDIGSELVRYAILAYLHDSSSDFEYMIKEAIANVPSAIHGLTTDDTFDAFTMMKEALESLHTKHIEKVDDDNVVEKFIHNVADEVRMMELVNMRVDSYYTGEISLEQKAIFVQTALRRLRKPKDNFEKEVLNWIAGKYGYDSVQLLLDDLCAIVKLSDADGDNKQYSIEDIENLIDCMIESKNTIVF